MMIFSLIPEVHQRIGHAVAAVLVLLSFSTDISSGFPAERQTCRCQDRLVDAQRKEEITFISAKAEEQTGTRPLPHEVL